jgi:hypothetical protein
MPDSTTAAPAQPEDKRTALRVARDAEEAASAALEVISSLQEHTTQLRQDLTDVRGELKEGLAALRSEPLAPDPAVVELRDRLETVAADVRAEFERITVSPVAQTYAEDFTQGAIQLVSERVAKLEADMPTMLEPLAPVARTSGSGVHSKMLEVMRAVTAIGKDQSTDSGPRYSFRGIDTIMNEVGRAMRAVGLLMTTEIRDKTYTTNLARNSSGTEILWTGCSLTVRYRFIDPDDNSTLLTEMVGEGRDNSDKATSKASSMALKYALLQALMIPTDDMDDADREAPQVQTERAAAPPAAPAKSAAENAVDALAAIRGVSRWPAPQRKARLDDIARQIQGMGLTDHAIEGATLRDHVVSTRATLPQAPAEASTAEHYPPDAGPGEYQPEHGGY